MNLLNETTAVPASRTIAEISQRLVEAGARQINQTYSAQGRVEGIDFCIEAFGTILAYRLPARADAVFQLLQKRRKRARGLEEDRKQAERIAWRHILRWVEAQLALVQTCQAEAAQVFMPYRLLDAGRTLYDAYVEHQGKFLPAPPMEGKR